MKLVRLRIFGFRGFNDEQPIDLSGQLVIYAGQNGTGKTTIGEAVEWLLYGKTLKRMKGDEISKREYAGSYRNAHFQGAGLPFVEAEAVDGTGTYHLIKRQLKDDESSILTLDGKPSQDLRQFGIGTVYDRALILQHTLQDFIFMKPKARYEVLSAMLGLDPLIEFRNTVEVAKNELPKRLTARVTQAQSSSAELLTSFKTEPLLRPVATAVEQGDLVEARKHLVEVGLGRVAAGTKEDDLLAALKATQAAKERSRLDWGRFSVSPLAKPEEHPALVQLAKLEEQRKDIQKYVSEAVGLVATSPKAAADPRRQQFIRLGLQLRDAAHPMRCPFCLRDTLAPEVLAELQKAVEVAPAARTPLASAQAVVPVIHEAVRKQWEEVVKVTPRLPSEAEIVTISEMTTESIAAREGYLASGKAVERQLKLIQISKGTLDEALAAMGPALKEGTVINGEAPDLHSALSTYAEQVRALPAIINGYAAMYAALDPHVKATLASAEEVRFLALIIRGLEKWSDLKIAHYIVGLQDGLQDLIHQTRQFIEHKQKEILGLRDKEIKTWYDLLNPGAQVGYDQMVPGTDNLELRARTFTGVMMAAPNLSASQLNCIGLAVYLACATRSGSPFAFLLIDDPIQSMDEDHTEAFKKQVIEKLLAKKFQVILLTHMENFADDVERLYRLADPLLYRMAEYTKSGPSIIWKGPEIKKLLEEARRNKDSVNDGFRMNAVQSLRQFVERFVKDLYVAETSASVSKKYENETWTRLRDLLRQCRRFVPSDEALLEDTHNFTSPYLHTDASLPQKVPPAGHLNPHYDSMKRLFEKYAAVLGFK